MISTSDSTEWLNSSDRCRMMRTPTSISRIGRMIPHTPNDRSTSPCPSQAPHQPQGFSASMPRSARSAPVRGSPLWSPSQQKKWKNSDAVTRSPAKNSSSPTIQRALSPSERLVCCLPLGAVVFFAISNMLGLSKRSYGIFMKLKIGTRKFKRPSRPADPPHEAQNAIPQKHDGPADPPRNPPDARPKFRIGRLRSRGSPLTSGIRHGGYRSAAARRRHLNYKRRARNGPLRHADKKTGRQALPPAVRFSASG